MTEPLDIDADPIFGSIKLAIDSAHENDMQILRLLDKVADRITGHDDEMQELREGIAALSNRIEALTQAGLHSVKA